MSKINALIFDRAHTNAIKGIAILLVMLGHIGFIPHAGAYGVVLFLMFSGFGLVQSYFNSGLGCFFSKRLSKVIIPYAVITAIWLIIFGHPAISNGDYYQLSLIFLGLDLTSSVDPSMWYIPYLIVWYIAFYVIFSTQILPSVKVILLFLFSIYLHRNAGIFPLPSGAGLYVTAFPIGVLMGVLFKKFKECSVRKSYLLSGFFALSAISLYASIYFYQGINNSFFNYAATNLSCAFLVVGVTSFLSILKANLVVFEFFGKISYEMYLLEYMFLMKCLWVLMLLPEEYMKPIAFIVIVAFFALVYKILLSFALKKINSVYKKIECALAKP